jgi:DNA-directed RNA polymerase specialized sigma24 family protein
VPACAASIERFEGRSTFVTWLYRIGVNETKRRLARRAPMQRTGSIEDRAIEVADEREGPERRAETSDL